MAASFSVRVSPDSPHPGRTLGSARSPCLSSPDTSSCVVTLVITLFVVSGHPRWDHGSVHEPFSASGALPGLPPDRLGDGRHLRRPVLFLLRLSLLHLPTGPHRALLYTCLVPSSALVPYARPLTALEGELNRPRRHRRRAPTGWSHVLVTHRPTRLFWHLPDQCCWWSRHPFPGRRH